jgi:peptidoglycan/LPS O-acetylase OafA/YrhL
MKLVGVEAARGFAALLVVLVHASSMLSSAKYFGHLPFAGVFKFGHAGVDFFFVLSGFIIYYVHAHELGRGDRLVNFARKRFVRIFPTYWVVLAIMGLLLVVSPTHARSEQQLGNIVTSILLVPWPVGPILDVAWSLKHEMLFYALFGLLFVNVRLGQAALAAWGALVCLNIASSWLTGMPWFTGVAGEVLFRIFNIEFFVGIGVAHALLARRIHWPRLAALLGFALFIGTGLHESWGPPHQVEWPPRHLCYAIGAGLVLYGLAGAELAGRLRVPGACVELGASSYSLYLVHTIVLMILQQVLLVLRPHVVLTAEIWFVMFVAIAVAAGVLFSRTVERPLLDLLRRRRLRPVTP